MEQMIWPAWLIVGVIAGWVANSVMHGRLGPIGDIVIGCVGALVAGFSFTVINAANVTGFSLWSLFVAFIGAITLLGAIRLLTEKQVHAEL